MADRCVSGDPDRLAFFLFKKMGPAIREFGMIRQGDRIAVAVSGGKDSLALLRLLAMYRHSSHVQYDLAAVHVLGDGSGMIARHQPLEAWLETEGIPARMAEPIMDPQEVLPLDCQRCTWLRRKTIFTHAQELGCNVVAFAHHADDAAQTTLMNLLYGGVVRTLAPAAKYFDDRFRLIRPLIYVPETDLAHFARVIGVPPPPPTCERAGSSRRLCVANMLKSLGRDYLTQARPNLIRAGLRAIVNAEGQAE